MGKSVGDEVGSGVGDRLIISVGEGVKVGSSAAGLFFAQELTSKLKTINAGNSSFNLESRIAISTPTTGFGLFLVKQFRGINCLEDPGYCPDAIIVPFLRSDGGMVVSNRFKFSVRWSVTDFQMQMRFGRIPC